MSERLYRVHHVRKDGRHSVMGPVPMTHKEALTLRSKLTDPASGLLVEATPHPCVDHDPANARRNGMGPYCLECIEEIEEEAAKASQRPRELGRQTRAD